MTTVQTRLRSDELEPRYEAAADPAAKTVFMRCGYYLRIPIEAGRVFRGEAGHRSDLMSATIPK